MTIWCPFAQDTGYMALQRVALHGELPRRLIWTRCAGRPACRRLSGAGQDRDVGAGQVRLGDGPRRNKVGLWEPPAAGSRVRPGLGRPARLCRESGAGTGGGLAATRAAATA